MKLLRALALSGFLACPYLALRAQEVDKLVFPDPKEEIWVVRSTPAKAGLPLGIRLSVSDPFARKVLAELGLPYHRSVIKLNQCSRNFSNNKFGPNVLYLSENQGGFPRHGLAILEGKQVHEFPSLNYVDLVLDEKSLADGELSIYSHELGHVMMMNIWDSFPERESVKQHVSMGVTDYSLAFSEGWGEHFQRLAYEGIPAYQKNFQDGFGYKRNARSLWHSSIDEELRIDGVVQNIYIWQKVMPFEDLSSFAPEQLVLLEHTSPVFNRTRLKNGQQMLSCEGVLATLFYRLDSNPVLRNNYVEPAFYERFLLSRIPAGLKPQDIFSPFENVFLKNFWVWSQIKDKVGAGTVLFLEFLKEWGHAFPRDREEIWNVFVSTTVGKTLSAEPGGLYEQAALLGMIGDYQRFMPASDGFKKSLAEWTAKALSGAVEGDANLGPEIWVENKHFQIRTTLWSEEEKKPLRINLNTCSRYDLMTFPGIDPERARKIIETREKMGFFRSLEEAKKSGFDPGHGP
jgi:hypothetical protein